MEPLAQGELSQLNKRIRQDIIRMIGTAKSGHPGGSLSCVEILSTLYFRVMNVDPEHPRWEGRDRFVLSKGHAAPALYAVLAHRGYFPPEELLSLRQFGSRLQGHPDMKKTPGVDASTGSLGQGLSIAVGLALGGRLGGKAYRVFVVVGDGEIQEGQFWEAAMAAAHYKLSAVTLVLDYNGLQIDGTCEEVMSLGNVGDKLAAFGFAVSEVDGHSIAQLESAFRLPAQDRPKCIIAHTHKGCGVSFMEDQVGWHGKAPNAEEVARALSELGGGSS
jgi:transketolase